MLYALPGGKATSTKGAPAKLERRGFIALGRIEDYSASVVYRHEQTLAKPKADRLELLRATRAHFGQIFMVSMTIPVKLNLCLQPIASRTFRSAMNTALSTVFGRSAILP